MEDVSDSPKEGLVSEGYPAKTGRAPPPLNHWPPPIVSQACPQQPAVTCNVSTPYLSFSPRLTYLSFVVCQHSDVRVV